MIASREVAAETACLQLFTWRYGEFTFGNDTVTAPDLDRCPSRDGHGKRYQPPVENVAGNSSHRLRGHVGRRKNPAVD
jgi:hypothetical protein